MNYLFAGRVSLMFYKARDKSYVNVPTGLNDPSDIIHVENVFAPRTDVDGVPNFFFFESMVPQIVLKKFYVPMLTCFYSLLRRLGVEGSSFNGSFIDDLDDATVNTWDVAMAVYTCIRAFGHEPNNNVYN